MPDQGQTEAPGPIDVDQLLECIPDESSGGLPRQDIHDAFASRSGSFDDEDFDAALHQLEADGHVRTTTRRVFGERVPHYRQTSR